MNNSWSRFLLGLASAILVAGAAMHAIAFRKVAFAVQHSNLPAFFGNSLKALWVADSITLMLVAAILVFLAFRQAASSGVIAVFCGVLLAASASILYTFLGAFFAAHMLVSASGAVLAAYALEKPHSNLGAARRVDGAIHPASAGQK